MHAICANTLACRIHTIRRVCMLGHKQDEQRETHKVGTNTDDFTQDNCFAKSKDAMGVISHSIADSSGSKLCLSLL